MFKLLPGLGGVAGAYARSIGRTAPHNPNRTFGVTYHTDIRFDKTIKTFDRGAVMKDLDRMKSLGVTMIRTDVCFGRVDIGRKAALEFDSWFAEEAGKRGLEVLIIIKKEEHIKMYAHALKDKVTYWQIGNELTNRIFSDQIVGTDATLETTVEWCRKTASLLKSIHPKAKIAFNPNDLPGFHIWYASWDKFYKALDAAGVPFDIIGVDSYPGSAFQGGFPTEVSRSIETAKKLAEKDGKEVWILETGAPSFGRSEELQACYVNDMVSSAVRAGTDGIFMYEAFNEPEVVSEVADAVEGAHSLADAVKGAHSLEASFGLFDVNGNPRPSFWAYHRAITQDRAGESIPLSPYAKWYKAFSPIYRLMMPIGGPMTFNDLADIPITESILGFFARYALGKTIASKKDISTAKGLAIGFGGAAVLEGGADRFYKWSGTAPVNTGARAAFEFLQGISILTGTTQISNFAAKDKDVKRRLFITSLIPPIIGTGLGLGIGPFKLLYLWATPLQTLAVDWAERNLYI
jgi:hypothetical protein